MINYRDIHTKILKIDLINLARSLIILEVIALMFSTAAAVIVEILIFLLFISAGRLRRRVFSQLKQPMVVMALVLYVMVSLGVIYSVAPFSESLDMWGSWRKLLLVPLAASVYTDSLWKQKLVNIFIGISTLAALVSFAGYIFNFTIYKFPVGIVVDNWAFQGMLFSVATFTCLVLLRFSVFSNSYANWLLKLSTLLLTMNIIFVTPGRSGYLAFVVLIMVFIFVGVQKKMKVIMLVLAPLIILSLLMASPVARNRLFKGIDEIKSYEQSPKFTSIGIRIVMWKNTVQLLKKIEHPVVGYGTSGFETAYKKQVTGQKGWQGEPVGDPHNQYLRILVEYGVIGLILFLLFIFSFFKQNISGPFYFLGAGVLLAWCATSMFSAHFTTFGEGRFLMIWCSALLSVNTIEQKNNINASEKDQLSV